MIETITVTDEAGMDRYRREASKQLTSFGGRLVGHGGSTYYGEPFKSLTIHFWRSRQAFIDWQEGAAFAPLRALREASATIRISIVPAGSAIIDTPPAALLCVKE